MNALDPLASASHAAMIAHLSGPFGAGAVESPLPIDGGGRAQVDWTSREPLLLLGTRAALAEAALAVTVAVTPAAGPAPAPVTLRFEPWTEPGAFLAAWRPDVDPTTRTAPPFQVVLTTGGAPPVWADALELRLVEGVMGRLIYLLGAEKLRLRRQARELAAGRVLAGAKLASLDRLGADLGVPRFQDRLVFDATQVGPDGDTSKAVVTAAYPGDREPDDAYRRRLALFRPFVQPSPAGARARLAALQPGLELRESDAELAVAMKLVAPGNDPARTTFLQYVRETYLVQPTQPVPASRFISARRRADEEALRKRLTQRFTFAAVPKVLLMPGLAAALDRVGSCRQALGIDPWQVLDPADADDSRHELGTGVDLAIPSAAELQKLGDAVRAGHLDAHGGEVTSDTLALLRSLTPASPTDDPSGAWLLRPCGLTTVHPLTGRLYVSHLPVHGMTITATLPAVASEPVPLEARQHAPGDPGPNAALFFALADAARAWTGPAWTVLAPAAATAAWARAAAAPAPLVAALEASGLRPPRTATELAPVIPALQAIPPELTATLQLGAAQAAALLGNAAGAGAAAVQLAGALRAAGLVAALPLATTTAGEVLLVVGVVQLPGQATGLGERNAVTFRWYEVPIQGARGGLERARGARTQLYRSSGVNLLVAVSQARRGSEDPREQTQPYEVLATLPDGQLLSLDAYERVMNLLERLAPIGVVVNTSQLRAAHVDLDGDGKADPLSPRLSRTFRPFRRRPHAGDPGES